MNGSGPVIIIEDDADDQEVLMEVFRKLGYLNKLHFFDDGHKALDYLNNTVEAPFLIISDINMPALDGFELRRKIIMDKKLHLKCIPFIFLNTASSKKSVMNAYYACVQGFFVKKNSIQEFEATIQAIMNYWQLCASPNSF